MEENQSRLQVLHRYLSPRIWQSEIVIAESLHLPNLNLENALRLGMHAHRNNIIGSTSIIAVKEKTLVCHCGSCAASNRRMGRHISFPRAAALRGANESAAQQATTRRSTPSQIRICNSPALTA